MKSFIKNSIYINVGFVVLAILLLVVFFVMPLLAEVKSDSENLVTIENSTAMLAIQNSQIENFKKEYQGYKPNLEKMDQMFIDAKNPADFIKFLENTASNAGVNAKISLQNFDQKDTAMTFQLFTSEDFLKILHFLETLEYGPYLLSIENLNMVSSGPQADNNISGRVDATFSVKVFAKQ